MNEIEPAKEGIRGHFGSAENVSAAVGLRFTKPDEFLHAALRITPDPAMKRGQHSIEPRRTYERPCRHRT
jgi:hypothetical protein